MLKTLAKNVHKCKKRQFSFKSNQNRYQKRTAKENFLRYKPFNENDKESLIFLITTIIEERSLAGDKWQRVDKETASLSFWLYIINKKLTLSRNCFALQSSASRAAQIFITSTDKKYISDTDSLDEGKV